MTALPQIATARGGLSEPVADVGVTILELEGSAGKWAIGAISSPDEIDRIGLRLDPGLYRIVLEADDPLFPTTSLLAPDGTPLFVNDAPDRLSPDQYRATGLWTIEDAGLYLVEVVGQEDSTGDYRVKLLDQTQRTAPLNGSNENDYIRLSVPGRVRANDGDDTVIGSSGPDFVYNHSTDFGDDLFRGRGGQDTLQGRRGDDTLFGGPGDDRLSSYSGDSLLRGGKGDDSLIGGSGRDRMFGGDGDDLIDGGRGQDTMTGGAGADQFIFEQRKFVVDVITDFQPGTDVIKLERFRSTVTTEQLIADAEVGIGGTTLFLDGKSLVRLRGVEDPADLIGSIEVIG